MASETRCARCLTVVEDGDRCLVCLDRQALDTIANALDCVERDADTLDLVADTVRSTGRVIRNSDEFVESSVTGCHCKEGFVATAEDGSPRCGACGTPPTVVTPEHLRTWLREEIARHNAQTSPPSAFKGGQGHTAEEIKESGDLWFGIIIVAFTLAAGVGIGWLAFHVR